MISTNFLAVFRRSLSATLWLTVVLLMGARPGLQAQTARFTGVQSTIETNFTTYGGMAIDSKGDIFVADDTHNRIMEITPAGPPIPITVGATPQYLALDSADNLYVATTGPAALKKLVFSNGSYKPPITIATDFTEPWGVAVDSLGAVYVSDHSTGNVYRFAPSPTGSYIQTTYFVALNAPAGLAEDSSNNLYVVESGMNRIIVAPAKSNDYVFINGFQSPSGVTVDSSGNVFVADRTGLIYDQARGEGTYSQYVLASDFGNPTGVALDATGSIYVADTTTEYLVKQTSAANFGAIAVRQSGSPQTLTFVFDEAGSLNANAPVEVLTMGAGGLDFAKFGASGSGACASKTYAVNQTCTVSVGFNPSAPGTRIGGVVLNSSFGTVAGTGYVTGQGLTPQLSFGTPLQSTVVSGGYLPAQIAADGLGNVYIADSANNRVLKETVAGGRYNETTIGTGLSNPYGVAVDGVGNVYIADTSNQRVLKETLADGGYVQSLVDDNGLIYPAGIAVDSAGNVYVADTANNRVLKDAAVPGGYVQTAIGSGLSGPVGVAVDGAGNVYIADTGNNRVVEETLSGGNYTQSILVSDLDSPSGVAVDGVGNVYITDDRRNSVVKETLFEGTYIKSGIGSGLKIPDGVGVDASGNVYIADNYNNRVLKETVEVAPPTLAFANTPVGTTSAAQVFTLTNLGNQLSSFDVPSSGTNPSTVANFTLDDAATSCGVVKGAGGGHPGLLPGTSCNLAYVFAPQQIGSLRGTPVLTDNNLNVSNATQAFTLTGTAIQGSQTITFPQPTSPIVYASGETVQLAATATSGLSVTYQVTSGPATVSGSKLTITGLGTIEVTASQAGNANYAAATPVSISIEVSAANTMIGGKSAAQPVLLQFTTAGTLATIQALTQGASGLDFSATTGGTCTTGKAYTLNQTCTVDVLFSPKYAGTRQGAVVLLNASKAPLATAYIQGTGEGAQLTFAPAQQSTVATWLDQPTGLCVDGAGNVYIDDTYNLRLLKETLSDGTYVQSTIPWSGAGEFYPSGFAVDGAGSLYLGDPNNARVVKLTVAGSSYTESTVTNGLNSSIGLAVDGAGTVYIADFFDNKVVKETVSANGYSQSIIGSNLNQPMGVAVDGVGNVYIADSGNSRVLKETPYWGGYIQSTVTAGLKSPAGVAVDGAGDLYIADSSAVLKVMLVNGVYVQSTLASGLNGPAALSVDAAGNVYIADTGNNRVLKETVTNAPSLTFPNTSVGQTSAAQAVTVTNLGTQSISFAAPTSGTNPATAANFILESNSDTTCPVVKAGATAGVLGPNTACNLSYVFSPTHAGDLSGTSVLTDNNLNVAKSTQTITLSGVANAQTISFPQPVSPVSYSSGETITLTATASSGLAVIYTVSSGPAMVSGSVLTLTGLGIVEVTASQPGNTSYAPAIPMVRSIVVRAASTTIGGKSSAQPVTVQFIAAGTVASIQALTQGTAGLDFSVTTGGTCTTGKAYSINQTCTVNVLFSPKYAGTRQGAVVLLNASKVPLATAYLAGTGVGPQLTFGPPQQTPVVSSGIGGNQTAVDGAGNVYIADTSNNRVLKETLTGGTYVQSTVGSGLGGPSGVAVDGAGNVYIGDQQNDRILKETPSGGGNYSQSTIATGPYCSVLSCPLTNGPLTVAVDWAGNVYVGDGQNYRVLKETLSGGSYVESTVVTGIVATSVAVDGSGNVYIADGYYNRVLKETPSASGYTQSIVATGIDFFEGLAVDDSGNVYVGSVTEVLKETPSANSYTQSIFASNLVFVWGLAVDGAGNVYVVDDGSESVVKETVSNAPTLTFPSTAVDKTSAPQAVAVTNLGNQAVTFAVPTSGVNPSTSANFTLESDSDTTCPVVKAGATAGTLAAGTSCNLSYVYAPVQTGPVTGTSVLTDNNLNVTEATQTITLKGTTVAP
jgi:DNA-binding beta-propeller fold protein YncE